MPGRRLVAQDSAPLLAAAYAATQRGWRVTPLYRLTKDGGCTCKAGARCSSAGKHPMQADWQHQPEMSGADVYSWWDHTNPPNLGVLTGSSSGFWVLDVDPAHGGADSLLGLTGGQPPLPPTRVVRTGAGGWHYYFANPTDFEVPNYTNLRGFGGLDVRGKGGQVVVPPSVSGHGPYLVHPDFDIEPAPAPVWLLDLVRPAPPPVKPPTTTAAPPPMTDGEADRLARYTDAVVRGEIERLRKLTTAGYAGPPWNSTTHAVACQLIEIGYAPWSPYSVAQAHADVRTYAPADAGFDRDAVEKILASVMKGIGPEGRAYPAVPNNPLAPGYVARVDGPPEQPEQVRRFRWDDLGNAGRLAAVHGHKMRWVEEVGRWAIYDGGRWVIERKREAHSLAQQVVRSMADMEGPAYELDQREAFEKFARAQGMSARISAMLREASADPNLQATMDDFDADPMKLNAANGVIDLRTGVLGDHDPKLLLMQQSPIPYDPAAPRERFWSWLCAMQPDPLMRDYLQRIAGYTTTGSIGEQAMFVHHGSGSNGKSVWLGLMAKVLGDYFQVVPRDALLVTHTEPHPTAVARMLGKRFLQVSETKPGRQLNEEVVKGLTGGERQAARFMGRDFFDFSPTGKLHLVTNHLPRVSSAHSIWRRLHLVPWPVSIDKGAEDIHLTERLLQEEAAGILMWLVDGCRWWLDMRLSPPEVALADLNRYRSDQDDFGEFCSDFLLTVPQGFASSADIYSTYKLWAIRAGNRHPMMLRDVSTALRERGFLSHRIQGVRGFANVRLLEANRIYNPLEQQQ